MSSFSRAISPRMLLDPSSYRIARPNTQPDIPEDMFDTPVLRHICFCLSSINPLLYNRDRNYLFYSATYAKVLTITQNIAQ